MVMETPGTLRNAHSVIYSHHLSHIWCGTSKFAFIVLPGTSLASSLHGSCLAEGMPR